LLRILESFRARRFGHHFLTLADLCRMAAGHQVVGRFLHQGGACQLPGGELAGADQTLERPHHIELKFDPEGLRALLDESNLPFPAKLTR